MRIIGGEARGRGYPLPRGFKARPTSDSLRENLFNILSPVEGKRFLDLFAGTGSVGLEALSRGARQVVFVEIEGVYTDHLKGLLGNFPAGDRGEVISADFGCALRDLALRGSNFDIVFADPPYARGYLGRVLGELGSFAGQGRILEAGGILVLQHSAREDLEEREPFLLGKRRRYGDSILTFMEMKNSETR